MHVRDILGWIKLENAETGFTGWWREEELGGCKWFDILAVFIADGRGGKGQVELQLRPQQYVIQIGVWNLFILSECLPKVWMRERNDPTNLQRFCEESLSFLIHSLAIWTDSYLQIGHSIAFPILSTQNKLFLLFSKKKLKWFSTNCPQLEEWGPKTIISTQCWTGWKHWVASPPISNVSANAILNVLEKFSKPGADVPSGILSLLRSIALQ